MSQPTLTNRRQFDRQRDHFLRQWERWLEMPMIILGIVWLALLIWDLTRGLPTAAQYLNSAIWIIFIIDFALRWALACRKATYLKHNWITAIALVVPALRVLQVMRIASLLRVARATNSIRLVRVLTSLNRGIRVLSVAMGERGFGYVIAMTLIVIFAGAAAMYAFERDAADGMNDYMTSVWWTAMIMTTMGSEYWPKTLEGRILCLLLAVYAFAIFGYVTAAIASILVGKENRHSQPAADRTLSEIRSELARLHAQLERIEQKQH